LPVVVGAERPKTLQKRLPRFVMRWREQPGVETVRHDDPDHLDDSLKLAQLLKSGLVIPTVGAVRLGVAATGRRSTGSALP
jgi:hypothetical protein